MPRIARILIENACYHIITRGNQKQLVFLEQNDYQKYIRLLEKYKNKFGFKMYAFCLMPNHVHLIIQVLDLNVLNRIMRGINLSYTLYFNNKYKKVGHLWQDRFKSKIIEKESYILDCINYIENNPVRAFLVSRANEYLWNSCRFRTTDNRLVNHLFDY
jgi:putative transposase